MPKMITITCKCGCKRRKEVREADVKRGWGLYYSKSCKAIHQTKMTGVDGPDYRAKGKSVRQMKSGDYAKSQFKDEDKSDWDHYLDSLHPFSSEALGQD